MSPNGIAQVVSDARNRADRFLTAFFYDDDAFTFKGAVGFLLQLFGLVAVLFSAQILVRPATIQARNLEPFGCIDLAQYEESFGLKHLPYPDPLRHAVWAFATRNWPNRSYQLQVGAVARGLPASPSEVTHQVLCWYVGRRSPERQGELRRIRDRNFAMIPQIAGGGGVDSQLLEARRTALGTDRGYRMDSEAELSVGGALMALKGFGGPGDNLDLASVLKPVDNESMYTKASAWAEDLAVAEIPSISDLVQAIESAGLEPLPLAWAFEQIDGVRRFFNVVEVTNPSGAVAQRATVSIYRQPGLEILGGTLQPVNHGEWLTAKIENVLPGETLHVILRTRRPVEDGDIQVVADPTLFPISADVRRLEYVAGVALVLWLYVNWRARKPRVHSAM